MKASVIRHRMNRICISVLVFIGMLTAIKTLKIYSFPFSDTIIDVFSYVLSYFFAVFSYKYLSKDDYQPFSLKKMPKKHIIPIIFSALFVFFIVSRLVNIIFPDSDTAFSGYQNDNVILFVLKVSIFPAFFEELFFRGVVLTNLIPFGKSFSIITSAVLFGLVHGTHDRIIFATVAGIVLGLVYVRTGSLWCSIIIHFLNNLITAAEISLYALLPKETAFKICLTVEFAIVFIGAMSIIYLLKIYKSKKETSSEEKKGDFSFNDYMKGFFSPATILFLVYAVMNEIIYVFFT